MVKGGTVKGVVCFVIEVRTGLPSRRGPWVLPWELQRHTNQSPLSSSFPSLPWASLPSPPGTYQPQRPRSYNSNSALTAIKWYLCRNQPAFLPFPWEPTTILASLMTYPPPLGAYSQWDLPSRFIIISLWFPRNSSAAPFWVSEQGYIHPSES